jgi:hypothetical protein
MPKERLGMKAKDIFSEQDKKGKLPVHDKISLADTT